MRFLFPHWTKLILDAIQQSRNFGRDQGEKGAGVLDSQLEQQAGDPGNTSAINSGVPTQQIAETRTIGRFRSEL